MPKNIRKRIIYGVLVLLVMGLIFLFSSETADESAKISGGLTEALARGFFPDWFLPENAAELSDHLSQFEYLIRKIAHFSEYLLLGGLLSLFFGTFDLRQLLRLFLAFLTGTVYATTDEFHQHFVAGRAMQGFDILIDAAGVLTGVLIFSGISAMIVLNQYNKIKGRNE